LKLKRRFIAKAFGHRSGEMDRKLVCFDNHA